jgi:hypothetical protein
MTWRVFESGKKRLTNLADLANQFSAISDTEEEEDRPKM